MENLKLILTRAAFAMGGLAGVTAMTAAPAAYAQSEAAPSIREIEVIVEGGYRPRRIVIREGEKVRLRFIRRDHGPCTREVVFPGLGIRRELPTHQPVVIELPALKAGEYELRCGMNMVRGELIVEK